MHCHGYTELLFCLILHKYPWTHVSKTCCSWRTTLGSQHLLDWAHQTKLWAAAPGHWTPGCPNPLVCGIQGSRETLTQHSMSFPEIAMVAWQKSSAAPDTAKVAWSAVRGSRATIQPLQLLWLNHLLNYTRKCAWNHEFHWFSWSCLKPE